MRNLRYGCIILRHYLDIEKGNLFRALGRYNGSLGRAEYPNLVLGAWKRHWDYATKTAQAGQPERLTAPSSEIRLLRPFGLCDLSAMPMPSLTQCLPATFQRRRRFAVVVTQRQQGVDDIAAGGCAPACGAALPAARWPVRRQAQLAAQSRISRSAVFLPIPGTRDSRATSSPDTASASSSAFMPDRIASAVLAPMPEIFSSWRKVSRSLRLANHTADVHPRAPRSG